MKTSNGFLAQLEEEEKTWNWIEAICHVYAHDYTKKNSYKCSRLTVPLSQQSSILFVSIIQKLGVHYAYSGKWLLFCLELFALGTKCYTLQMEPIFWDTLYFSNISPVHLKMHCCTCPKIWQIWKIEFLAFPSYTKLFDVAINFWVELPFFREYHSLAPEHEILANFGKHNLHDIELKQSDKMTFGPSQSSLYSLLYPLSKYANSLDW